jgi:hypothetical protein
MIGLIFWVIFNSVISVALGVAWGPVGLGLVIGLGFSFPLQAALRDRSIRTMQDGLISFADRPVKFISVVLLIAVGYGFGILTPWLFK